MIPVPLVFLTLEDFPALWRVREVLVSVGSSPPHTRHSIPDGPFLVSSLTNLGINFCNNNRLPEAEEILLHAINIQECINHRMHHNLLRPLITLGAVFAQQRRFDQAEPTLLRALVIAGKTEAMLEEHGLTLRNLIYVYHEQNRIEDKLRMQDYMNRLLAENPFVIKDRHLKPNE